MKPSNRIEGKAAQPAWPVVAAEARRTPSLPAGTCTGHRRYDRLTPAKEMALAVKLR